MNVCACGSLRHIETQVSHHTQDVALAPIETSLIPPVIFVISIKLYIHFRVRGMSVLFSVRGDHQVSLPFWNVTLAKNHRQVV